MATIQVRDIPEEAYEVIRKRARAEGKSIQAYMRAQVLEIASRPTKDEVIATIEASIDRFGAAWRAPKDIVTDVGAERR